MEHNTSPLAALISLPNAETTLWTKPRRLFSANIAVKRNPKQECKLDLLMQILASQTLAYTYVSILLAFLQLCCNFVQLGELIL